MSLEGSWNRRDPSVLTFISFPVNPGEYHRAGLEVMHIISDHVLLDTS